MSDVLVVGAGAWGRALARQAQRAGATVTLWARTPRALEGVRVVHHLPETHADAILLATPLQHLRAVLEGWRPGGPLVIACKGLERGTAKLPTEIVADRLPDHPCTVLTGPTFAAEIEAGLPAAAVVAGGDAPLRAAIIATLGTQAFRLYGNDDAVGAQLGGAGKNVIAIAAGVVVGAGLGENARAALVTRGLSELTRAAVRLGGRPETVAGLSGMGDLLLTCTGVRSRNFRFGHALGEGLPVEAALQRAGGVVEGVPTAAALLARAAPVDMPVIAAVADLLDNRLTVATAAARLLARDLRDE